MQLYWPCWRPPSSPLDRPASPDDLQEAQWREEDVGDQAEDKEEDQRAAGLRSASPDPPSHPLLVVRKAVLRERMELASSLSLPFARVQTVLGCDMMITGSFAPVLPLMSHFFTEFIVLGTINQVLHGSTPADALLLLFPSGEPIL